MTDILAVLRWSLSLGAKFYRVVPVLTLLIIFLTLVAQISSLLSFFLPLKIVILLGSEGMPHYFPAAFDEIDRDLLIAWLSATTVGFFLLSLLANKLIEQATDVAAGKLLSKSQKMVLFENQDDVAAKGYQRYSSALAGGVFILLALTGLGWFYPSMAGLIAGYLFFVFIILLGLRHVHEGFRDYLDKKLSPTLALAGNLGFFVVFAYLVFEFIFFSPPSFIIAIISILISRQAFGRAAGLVNAIVGLANQRPSLDALFFHGKVLVSQQLKHGKKNLWSFLAHEQRINWLLAVLEEAGVKGWSTDQLRVVWLESSQPNMPHLLLFPFNNPEQQYLIKLFDINRKSLAQHEATLATDMPRGIPMPEMVLITQVGSFPCHLYKLSPGKVLTAKESTPRIQALMAHFFTLELSTSLVGRYLRSRPLLADRLTPDLLGRLYVASNNCEDTLRAAELLERLPEIQRCLKSSPLVLFNPNIKSSIWRNSEDQSLLVLNWEKWLLEPLGAGWPVSEKSLTTLADMLAVTAEKNKNLKKYRPDAAQLAALVFELERLIKKQQLLSALNLLPQILNKLDLLQQDNFKE